MLVGTETEASMLPQDKNKEIIEDNRVFYVSPINLTGSFAKHLTQQGFDTYDAVVDTLGATILAFKVYASNWVKVHKTATSLQFGEHCGGKSRIIESWGAEVEANELWQFLENMKKLPEVGEWNKPLLGFIDLDALQRNIFSEIAIENEEFIDDKATNG